MSFEIDQLSGDDSSSWSKFGSSDEEVHELLVKQEALSDVHILKSADRMRLLEKDSMASKIRRFYEFQRTISP